jgi:uncharacterized membrane protein YkoI/ferric-dicitrate binding protein FerR (iron transport regulator)
MDLTRFEELLGLWQDGEASAGEMEELRGLLEAHPEFRRELVGSVLLEAGLYRRYTAPQVARGSARGLSFRKRPWEAAAALLVVAASLFLVGRLLFRGETALARVTQGAVWHKNAPASTLSDGQSFDVRGHAPAMIVLREGTSVILEAGSAGRIPSGSAPFELSRGSGTFEVGPAGSRFRVSTPAGQVEASGAQFWLLLRPSLRKSAKGPELIVETTRGRVQVDAWDTQAAVAAGSRRVFGPPLPPGGGRYPELLDRASFGLSEAIGRAQALSGGVPIRAEIEEEDGRAAFAVSLALEKTVREIALDLGTGRVLEDDTEPEDRSEVGAAVRIPLATMIDKALKTTPGRAVEAEYELKGGHLRAEIKVYAPGGLSEVKVDGETGEILSSKRIDPESPKK